MAKAQRGASRGRRAKAAAEEDQSADVASVDEDLEADGESLDDADDEPTLGDGDPDGGALQDEGDDGFDDDDAGEDGEDGEGLTAALELDGKQGSARELAVRRAIEERREARRLKEDLDYLDLDD